MQDTPKNRSVLSASGGKRVPSNNKNPEKNFDKNMAAKIKYAATGTSQVLSNQVQLQQNMQTWLTAGQQQKSKPQKVIMLNKDTDEQPKDKQRPHKILKLATVRPASPHMTPQ